MVAKQKFVTLFNWFTHCVQELYICVGRTSDDNVDDDIVVHENSSTVPSQINNSEVMWIIGILREMRNVELGNVWINNNLICNL